MLFDKFENKKIITGVITAIDPIHIGSSQREGMDPTQVDNSVIKDASGKPIIPGSSLKGVIRSNFEAVLRSVGKKACNVFDTRDKICLTNEELNSISNNKSTNYYEKAEKMYDKSCDACKLFGGRGVASKLQFKDCAFIGEKCVYEYRDGVGIDRETGAAKGGAKYDFEIVPKGSKFTFYMTAENLDDDQKKYLDYILNVLESGELSIGGMTTRGLGRIRLEDREENEISLVDLQKALGLLKE